jgi:hypothetical protein
MFSFVLAMTAAFLGRPAIANDLESGIALALLARPIRRSAYSSAAGSAGPGRRAYAAPRGSWRSRPSACSPGTTPPEPLLAVVFLAAQASPS